MRRLARHCMLALMVLLAASSALAQELPQGSVDEIKVEGNRRSEADAIISIIQTSVGRPLDTSAISEDIKNIFALGFYRDIQVDLTINAAGKRIVTFKVVEKPSIKAVEYDGNDELSDDELAEVVDIRQFGVLNLAKVTRNAEKIKELYIEKGFFLNVRKIESM